MAKKKSRKRARGGGGGGGGGGDSGPLRPPSSFSTSNVSAPSSSSSSSTSNACIMDMFVALPRSSGASAAATATATATSAPVIMVLNQLLDRSEDSGFTHVALTHTVYGTPRPDQDCADMVIPTSALWETASNDNTEKNKKKRRRIKVLRRLHAVVESVSDVGFYAARKEQNVVLKDYDLISLAPRNEQAFVAACNSATACEIISLDYTIVRSGGLSFRIRAPQIKAAVERNVRFEICYASAILHANHRKAMIQASREFQMACRSLKREGKQRSLLFSSGDRRRIIKADVESHSKGSSGRAGNESRDVGALALRTPGDLRNLLETVLRFDCRTAASALSSAGLGAIQQGKVRRFGKAATQSTTIESIVVEKGDCRLTQFQKSSKPQPDAAAAATTAAPEESSLKSGTDEDEDDDEEQKAISKSYKTAPEQEADTDDEDDEQAQDGFISF